MCWHEWRAYARSCRLSRHGGGSRGSGPAAAAAAAVDTVFHMSLTVTSKGKVSGWLDDTVGHLMLRGEVDPKGGGAVLLDAAFTECGGLPRALFATRQHGRARLRMCGWATATQVAGEWQQWSGGSVSQGLFLMWPNDGKEGNRGMQKSS